MLINLSNHPSNLWAEAQKEAALQFGETVDIPFPAVDPGGGSDYIRNMAREYFEKIMDIAETKENITVHLMGEMTFIYALAGMLLKEGIRCVASTTERLTTDLGNGQKESVFHFVRFRDYY